MVQDMIIASVSKIIVVGKTVFFLLLKTERTDHQMRVGIDVHGCVVICIDCNPQYCRNVASVVKVANVLRMDMIAMRIAVRLFGNEDIILLLVGSPIQ
jgi:hypothetical protein